jgi:hypothetical protein
LARITWTPKENDMKLKTILTHTGACLDARIWAKTQPDLETAWSECKRPDWMLWLLARTTLDQDDPRFRLTACDFAEAALIYVPAGEDRPRQAIEVGRRFAAGDATREELSAAWAAAGGAAWAAWTAARAAQSDIIRRYFPECPEIKPELLHKAV